MALKYAELTNEASQEYEVLLHGVVGREINGSDVAREIKLLNDMGATKITLRINSVGGLITEGMSIVAAILNSKADIHTFNEGTADSMALVILASGDEGCRGAYDYATGIIHDPLMGGTTLEDIEDEKLKSFMTKTKESLVTIFENATGKTRDEIGEAMKEELMLNASELQQFGIVDFVSKSKKQPKIKAGASIMERMAACSAVINNNDKNMDFKSKYEEAVNEVSGFRSQVESLTAEKETLTAEVENLKAELEPFKAKVAEMEAEQRKNYVDKAIKTGVWEESDRETLENLAANDFEGFKKTVDSVKAPQLRATDIINMNDREEEDEDDTRSWNFSDWEKKDPAGLLEMRFTNSALYNKLKEEDDKQYQTA